MERTIRENNPGVEGTIGNIIQGGEDNRDHNPGVKGDNREHKHNPGVEGTIGIIIQG